MENQNEENNFDWAEELNDILPNSKEQDNEALIAIGNMAGCIFQGMNAHDITTEVKIMLVH